MVTPLIRMSVRGASFASAGVCRRAAGATCYAGATGGGATATTPCIARAAPHVCAHLLHGVEHFEAVDDSAEDGVLACVLCARNVRHLFAGDFRSDHPHRSGVCAWHT